jgi:predicted double-glycine peptidase
MFSTGDARRIRKEGFSMLDMRRYLASQGFDADGFQLPLEKLAEEGLPAIVLLNDRGYRHFVVVKGMHGDRILLGDPSRGTRAMPRAQFERLWDNRVLFVVHNRRELAQFNRAADWRIAPGAPIDTVIQREGVQNFAVPRRGPGDF